MTTATRSDLPELEGEAEVDLRSAWRRVVHRWWLPVGGLIVGAVVGVLVAMGSGSTYSGATLLYLGQPFTPSGGGQIQSLQTNPRTVGEIVRSEAVVREAAAEAGLRPGQLRGNISTKAIVQTGQSRTTSPLVEIKVTAPNRARAAAAADALAQAVVDRVSPYISAKIDLLENQIESSETELGEVQKRITDANDQLAEVRANRNLSDTDRLIAVNILNSTLGFAEQRRGTVQQELFQNQQLLSLARNVEESKIVQNAVGRSETARSRRNAALVGAVIGLLLGALAAYLADPILARRSSRPAR